MADHVLTFAEHLCRHGCGEPLARPRNRFVNGHDAQLLDRLLDAHKAGDRIIAVAPGQPVREGAVFTAAQYAQVAFFPRGNRWFRIRAGIEEPAYDELAGAEDPDLRTLSLGGPSDEGLPSLAEDLETVRKLVARASDSGDGDLVNRLAAAEGAAEQLSRLAQERLERIGELERELLAMGSVSVLAGLSSKDARWLLLKRIGAAANVLAGARFNRDHRELVDLLDVFSDRRWVEGVHGRAVRALLGQELEVER